VQWRIVKIDEKQRWTAKISTSCCSSWIFSNMFIVAESIFSDRFTTRSRINALTVHTQTLLSCLKHTAVDRLRVRLNVLLLCRGYMWNKIISKLFQPSSTSVSNSFISASGYLPKIISILFHRLIAAHEYFPICSLSLK